MPLDNVKCCGRIGLFQLTMLKSYPDCYFKSIMKELILKVITFQVTGKGTRSYLLKEMIKGMFSLREL